MSSLGIDIGTSSISASLVLYKQEEDEFQELYSLSKKSNADIVSSSSWEQTQDVSKIIKLAEEMYIKLKSRSIKKPDSIGVSSQMHGFLYVDKEGNARSPLYTWRDMRAAEQCFFYDKKTKSFYYSEKYGNSENSSTEKSGNVEKSRNPKSQVEKKLFSACQIIEERTGITVPAGYAMATHYYNSLRSLVAKNSSLVSIGSYFVMKLCGQTRAILDPSEAASFGLYNLRNMEFETGSMAKLWPSLDFIPNTVPFHHQSGYDAEGIPVFQSLGDNQASFYGAMRNREDSLLINMGTGSQISCIKTKLNKVPQAMEFRPYPKASTRLQASTQKSITKQKSKSEARQDHRFLFVASLLSGAHSFSLLVDFFKSVCSFYGYNVKKADFFKKISSFQLKKESNNVLEVEPYFLGSRSDAQKRASILQIGKDNFNARSLILGTATGIIQELKQFIARGKLQSFLRSGFVYTSGNGISKNPFLQKQIEHELQCSIEHVDAEVSSLGAAYYAFNSLQNI